MFLLTFFFSFGSIALKRLMEKTKLELLDFPKELMCKREDVNTFAQKSSDVENLYLT